MRIGARLLFATLLAAPRMLAAQEVAPGDTVHLRLLDRVARTRDIGIMFSAQRRSFTHRVDPHIDDERDNVVSDLVAANAVAALSLVPRAEPEGGATVNGARTPVVTDWRMAVLVLR